MRNIRFICYPVFLLIMNCAVHAQSKDTIATKNIIAKGSKGDIIIGEKIKKDQLNNTPILLHPTKTFGRKNIIRSSKEIRKKQIKKGS